MARVLVIEDDPAIGELVRLYLAREGHGVELVSDGAEGLRRVETAGADLDLIVLDLMLPGLDGRGVCRRIRAGTGTAAHPDVPIIMLTALDDPRDTIEGLDLGADDYLTKPFDPDELLARVRALLRRAATRPIPQSPTPNTQHPPSIALGNARLDPGARRLLVAGRDVPLRTKEFDLLLALAAHPGLVLTRDQLLERVWGTDVDSDTRTVDVHVSRLRDKLTTAHATLAIDTVRSVGYRLRDEG